jgi:VIT1/CCC1 family predicted Fe2+/Mn2+ transporter
MVDLSDFKRYRQNLQDEVDSATLFRALERVEKQPQLSQVYGKMAEEEAAFTSFFLFALGAFIPLAPFIFLRGSSAVLTSLGVSGLGMFVIGAAITLLTGKNPLFAGFRQILFGLAAAGVTFLIGRLIGVSLAG